MRWPKMALGGDAVLACIRQPADAAEYVMDYRRFRLALEQGAERLRLLEFGVANIAHPDAIDSLVVIFVFVHGDLEGFAGSRFCGHGFVGIRNVGKQQSGQLFERGVELDAVHVELVPDLDIEVDPLFPSQFRDLFLSRYPNHGYYCNTAFRRFNRRS